MSIKHLLLLSTLCLFFAGCPTDLEEPEQEPEKEQNDEGDPKPPAPQVDAGSPDTSTPEVDAGSTDAPAPDVDAGSPDAPAPEVDAGSPDISTPEVDAGSPNTSTPEVDAGSPDTPTPEEDAGTSDAPTPNIDAGSPETPDDDEADAGSTEIPDDTEDAGPPSCDSGTEWDGTICADVNECATNFGGCGDPNYSTSTNTWCPDDDGQCDHDDYYTCTNNVGAAPTCGTIPEDITNAIFDSQDRSCTAYIGSYFAVSQDIGSSTVFYSDVEISDSGDHCTITSDAIPNHDFNDGDGFANAAAEVVESYDITKNPTVATTPTALSLQWDNAIFLNGAKLDLLPAACYGVGPGPVGQEKIGCFDMNKPWRYDPMFAGNDFDTDSHNAHTQPDGAYHYHGDPASMYDDSGNTASGVIGFAADGFPIFGPYIDDNGTIRQVQSGYVLKSGDRVSQNNEGVFPGGTYDGTFIDDYEFDGSGDLDECNGMVNGDGEYAYYVTYTFPWVMRCFTGTPNSSFQKSSP